MVNYETVLGLTIFLCLGYYLQTGPQIGDFLPRSTVAQFEEEGIVIVDNLFSPEQLENISSELMLRVNNRAAGVRAVGAMGAGSFPFALPPVLIYCFRLLAS